MRYLDAAALRAALPMTDAIDAVKAAFVEDGEAPQRVMIGVSLFMPARVGSTTGIKVVSSVPGNPAGIVVVFDEQGSPAGFVDGPTLTALRTGATSGLATDLMAARDARVLAIFGTGAMAQDQVDAVRAVRAIDEVLVWSRSDDRRRDFADLVGGRPISSPDEAVAAADIVTTVTPATAPLFNPDAVEGRTHINAVGSFTPQMVEIPPEVVRRAMRIVDDIAACAVEAGDLIQAGVEPEGDLGDVITGRIAIEDDVITLYKTVGAGTQDVAVAAAALQRAAAMNLGVAL